MYKIITIFLAIFLFNNIGSAKNNDKENLIDNLSIKINSNDESVQVNDPIIIATEVYLNNINNIIADFIQIGPNGEESTGKFFLSRPGKLRWQYDIPNPILIVVNDKMLTYYDYELDQISYVSAEDNLAAFLTRKNIKYGKDIIVKKASKSKNTIKINIVKKNKEEEGELTIIFTEKPMELRKIEILDAMNQITSITLNNLQKDLELDKNLFIVKNPRFFKTKRE